MAGRSFALMPDSGVLRTMSAMHESDVLPDRNAFRVDSNDYAKFFTSLIDTRWSCNADAISTPSMPRS
jgi:hypothetical protein